MDLLRLVISRWPLQFLGRLDHLLRSPAFIRIRIGVMNPRGFDPGSETGDRLDDYIRLCTLQGELSTLACNYLTLEDLRARAVFLRLPVWYNIFHDMNHDSDVGFWMAIKSGISEIQAMALIPFVEIERLGYFNQFLEDAPERSSIPWTQGLFDVISTMASTSENERWKGFLNRKVRNPETYRYFTGVVERLNGPTETALCNAAIEILLQTSSYLDNKARTAAILMEVGYLYRLERYLTDENFDEFFHSAVQTISAIGMRLVLERYGKERLIDQVIKLNVGRKYQLRARLAVQDQWLMENLPPYTRNVIRMLAGEIVREPIAINLRSAVGSPGPSLPNIDAEPTEPDSITEFFIFDPVWSSDWDEDQPIWRKTMAEVISIVYGFADLIDQRVLLFGMNDVEDENEDFNENIDSGKVPLMKSEEMRKRLSPVILSDLGIPEDEEVSKRRLRLYQEILAKLTGRA